MSSSAERNRKIKELVVGDIVKEADEIYAKCKKYKKEKGGHKKLDEKDFEELHKLVQRENHNFISTYPVVVRSMVYEGVYYSKALEKYIMHLKNHPWNDKSEYLDRQADWYVYLERERNPRMGGSEVAKFRDRIRKAIAIEEDKEFMKAADKTKAEVEAERDVIMEDRKNRLLELIKQKIESGELPNYT